MISLLNPDYPIVEGYVTNMLSALRLVQRQSVLQRQWKCMGQAMRFIQKGDDDIATVPPSTAAATARPDTDAAFSAHSDAEAAVSPQQLQATFQALRRLFAQCQTVDELLETAQRRQLTATESLVWLTSVAHMAMDQGVPATTVTSHPCYRAAAEQVNGRTENMAPHKLLAPARALVDLGVPLADPLLASLINDLVWNLRKMTMKQLVQSFCLARRFPDDGQVKQLLALSQEMIQRRWVELTTPEEILPILKHSASFSAEFLRRLDDRALDVAGQVSASHASRLLAQLAALGRRPLPLLRALCFHSARQPEPVSVKDAVRCLFAMQKLNFPDQMLLEKLGRDLVTQTPAVERPGVLSSALTAAGLLRWRHVEFLEAAAQWHEKHAATLRPQDAVSLIITLATVNYCPANAATLLPALLERCPRAELPSPLVWLDLVWSLAVLGRASADQLRSVLEPEFCRQLAARQLALGARLKLLNLAALARLRDGLQEPQSAAELGVSGGGGEAAAPPQPREAELLQKAVLEALVNFLPPPRYLRVGAPPAAAAAVDAEFVVGDDGAPLPCEPYGSALPGSPAAPAARPPPGVHRVALCTWTYRDFTLDSVELTGYNKIVVDLLELSGYKVLEVSHAEFKPQDSVVQKVKFLRQKIRDLVAVR